VSAGLVVDELQVERTWRPGRLLFSGSARSGTNRLNRPEPDINVGSRRATRQRKTQIAPGTRRPPTGCYGNGPFGSQGTSIEALPDATHLQGLAHHRAGPRTLVAEIQVRPGAPAVGWLPALGQTGTTALTCRNVTGYRRTALLERAERDHDELGRTWEPHPGCRRRSSLRDRPCSAWFAEVDALSRMRRGGLTCRSGLID